MNLRPHSLKTLHKFLKKNPNVCVTDNGQIQYLVFSHCTANTLHWDNRAGKPHSSDYVGGGFIEPGIEFTMWGFTIEKGEKIKRFEYMTGVK